MQFWGTSECTWCFCGISWALQFVRTSDLQSVSKHLEWSPEAPLTVSGMSEALVPHLWGSSRYLWGTSQALLKHFCNTFQALLRWPQMMPSSNLWISSRIRYHWNVQLAGRHSAMIRERCIITNPYDPQHETDCFHKSFSSWNARKALPRGLCKEL